MVDDEALRTLIRLGPDPGHRWLGIERHLAVGLPGHHDHAPGTGIPRGGLEILDVSAAQRAGEKSCAEARASTQASTPRWPALRFRRTSPALTRCHVCLNELLEEAPYAVTTLASTGLTSLRPTRTARSGCSTSAHRPWYLARRPLPDPGVRPGLTLAGGIGVSSDSPARRENLPAEA